MKNKIFNIPNLLSASRFFLLIPIAWLLLSKSNSVKILTIELSENRIYALFLMALLFATDVADGYFARKLNQITELGKALDPVADKISVGVIALILYIQKDLPAWYVAIVIARDVIIMLAGLILSTRIKYVLPSNIVGKLTLVSIGIVIILSTLKIHGALLNLFIGLSLVMILASIVSYSRRFFKYYQVKLE